MKDVEFNLLEEPWIRVLRPDCTVEEVSLTDALLRAHEFRDLAGELPTQDAATLRLLLAVLHTVFSRKEGTEEPAFSTSDEALLGWSQLWRQGSFPAAPIREYLAKWRERFWLFHPQRPFYQVPEAKAGTQYGAEKLNGEISQSGNKIRLFSSYAGEEKKRMTYAQAARWLLAVNGFDDTSAKPKGKNLPSVGAGWLGKLGLILAQGKNLFETLMLNLVVLRDGETLWGPQRPCWELEQARSGERTEIVIPDNAAGILTLQSRRLLLFREGGAVVGYALLGGDFFEKENAFAEQMTVWCGAQRKKDAPVVFQPLRHDPAKQLWREFTTIFSQQPDGRRPGVVRWIALLQTVKLLDPKAVVRFRVAAVHYGDKDFVITDTFGDELTFHAFLLGELGKVWRHVIDEEIARCEALARAVETLARDLIIAGGGSDMGQTRAAKEQFYFQLDQPFRTWLYGIDADWDEEEREQSILTWQAQAKRLARAQGQKMAEDSGPAAFVGRAVRESGKKEEKPRYYCAPNAYNHFLYRVQRVYNAKEGGKK